ncbi:MAG: hypothetical protein O7I42_06155 [Alphaproteobacteria bacterium]|nr:hypothetical protein [Alphaproteobacteria bacterium]
MRRQTETTAAAASSASDPVAQIGRDLAATWRQVWRNDEERLPADAPVAQRTRSARLDYRLADRWEALEAMAAEIPASTLDGAMVQIMLAHAAADLMEADSADATAAVQMRIISRLLYSALAVVEQVAGVPREQLGGEAYMRRDLDPHALLAEATEERAA